ncbi:E3 ubiquitin-protein ligase SPL2 isoform X2 [Aristolochia californica]|uniref:E3 ubiquitin-protein ligase SPL2 isoform X2 n=1 Tax=Aristolochia californica TaxID=171875 RepID=UPI0035D8D6AD
MSSYDQAVAATLTQIALAYDGAFVGMTLAIAAIKTILKYRSSSSALARIRRAPSPKSAVDGKWMGFRDKVLVSEETGERAVIVQRTQTCLYNEWRGLIWLTYDLRTLFGRHRKKHQSTSLRMVPFVLTTRETEPESDCVIVNLNGSNHPLPLTTIYNQMHPVQASAFTFLQAVFGHGYPVGLLDEQKILPVGQEVTAVGICRSQDGVLEIKSSKEIPYFLSEMTKDQMEVELAVNIKTLLWSGVVLGMLSFGILGYSLLRNWARWKQWRHRRQHVQEQQSVLPENSGEDEAGDVPDGELCVICLMTRRRSAFVPCGHLVCCPRCALSVERDLHPKCPVCRQAIRTSLRIYAS